MAVVILKEERKWKPSQNAPMRMTRTPASSTNMNNAKKKKNLAMEIVNSEGRS